MGAMARLILGAILTLAWASGAGANICDQAAASAARAEGVPVEVLRSITRVETMRRGAPWPWSVNREGEGFVFENREEVLRFARKSRAAGRLSFDLGCFQLNYRWHGSHFDTLEAMVDPAQNARYAARFLRDLYAEMGSWSRAAGAYHSRTPRYATAYRAKFDKQLAALTGGTVPAAPKPVRVAAAEPPRPNRFPLLQKSAGQARLGSLVTLGD